MATNNILFVSHDAFRAGAQILLLNLLSWFKQNTDLSFQVLLKDNWQTQGELQPQFETLAPVFVFNQRDYGNQTRTQRLLKYLGKYLGVEPNSRETYLDSLKQTLLQANFDLIYLNTVANGEVVEFLEDFNCPMVCHVHELEFWIQHRVGAKAFNLLKQRVDRFIAVSEAVQQTLVAGHQIDEDKVAIAYEFIQADTIQADVYRGYPAATEIFQTLGISPEAKVVCASGTIDWRKGPDLFIQLAATVCKQELHYPVHFMWVGGNLATMTFAEIQYDLKKARLEQWVHFVGVQTNPRDYFAASDVFVLTSREDPFPLVCLEAASVQKPIVCFEGAGGEPEFVETDCGFVVPYLDIQAMAAKVIELLNSSELCQTMGQTAQQKVKERYTVETIGPQIETLIKQTVTQ
jgi:glycosyltransferase involved in cell wall biosynthesis